MGGESKSTTTQQSTTNPWAEATPALQGILGQLQGQMGSTALTGNENDALNSITANGQNPNAGLIQSLATSLLNGGGATGQAGAVQTGYDDLKSRLGGAADPNYSSLDDPKLRAALDQIQSDVGTSVNGQFAAAGRDFSGANQQAYGRGVSAAQTPLVLDQFNKDRTLQQNAATTLFNGQNTTSGLLTGMNQQDLTNKLQGVTTSTDAVAAKNSGATATLAAEAARRGIPTSQLGLLAKIGVPIAALGKQSSGTSETVNDPSLLQEVSGWTNVLASMFGGGSSGGGGAAGGLRSFFFG